MDNKNKGILSGGVLGGLLLGANAGKILRGVTFGLIGIVVAFIIIISSVNGVKENSQVVANLPLTKASEAQSKRGLVKIFGQIKADGPVALDVKTCVDAACLETKSALAVSNLIYKSIILERYEVIREVEKSEEGTNTTTEKVSYKNEWVEKGKEEDWAEIMIDGIALNPLKARVITDKTETEIAKAYIPNLEPLVTYDRTASADEPVLGTTRARVEYLPLDDREYIVIGENRTNGISSGDTFIITDASDSELVSQLGGEETFQRWFMRFAAFVILTLSFTSILSPILVFTDWIPLAGQVARGIATLVSGILAGIIVLATVFLLNYWWIILILIILALIGFAAVSIKGQKKV